MKKIVPTLMLATALTGGCTSIEQGSPAPEPYATPCPAIPEALKADNQDDIIMRAGSAILACAQENNGEIRVTPTTTHATIAFEGVGGKLTISAMSAANPEDTDEFARNTRQVMFTNAQTEENHPTEYTSVSLHNQVGWHLDDDGKFLWTNPQYPIAAITEGSLQYIDRSAEPRAIRCTNKMILEAGVKIASLGPDNLDRPMPDVPDKLPRGCDVE